MTISQQIIASLQSLGSEAHRLSKQRFGVPYDSALGVSLPDIRALAKQNKRNQPLDIVLSKTDIVNSFLRQ